MFKEIAICFVFLFSQLALMSYVDHRIANSTTEARYTSTSNFTANRSQKEDEEELG